MPDTIAPVNRPTQIRYGVEPGKTMEWDDYVTNLSRLDGYLEDGDRLFLVGAHTGGRGERLWLIAVYEDVKRVKGKREGMEPGWYASKKNRVPVTDITALGKKLCFHTGNGLTKKRGKLGNSLQTPRMLTDQDIAYLDDAIRRAGGPELAARTPPVDQTALEGQAIVREITQYVRNPRLALECLRRDSHTCRVCGFSTARFATKLAGISRVVHVHHIDPLHRRGPGETRLEDLVTLCPTCHAVAHAIARETGAKRVDETLLKKYVTYRAPIDAGISASGR